MRPTRQPHVLSSLGLAVVVTVAAPRAGAGDATLDWSDGVLGSQVVYTLGGDAGQFWYFLPSLTSGPTPLALVDPLDPRVLDVGIDLLGLAKLGFFAVGSAQVSYALPADGALAGLEFHAQFFTLFGSPTLADEISNPTAFVLSLPAQSHLSVGENQVQREGHTVTALGDGRVLVVGGDSKDTAGNITPLASIELYDTENQSFAYGTSLPLARSTHTATLLADGRVLLLGGYDGTQIVKKTGEIWDPATGLSTPTADMAVARTQHTATRMSSGKVLVAGGSAKFDLGDLLGSLAQASNKTESYDPASNSWAAGPNLAKPTIGHAASLLGNGQVLITGGVEVDIIFGVPIPSMSNRAQRYEPSTNLLVATANLPAKRTYHGQVTRSDGTALIVGGADGDFVLLNFFALASCYRYSSTTNSWSPAPALNFPRAYVNLVDVAGELYAIGGLSAVDVSTATGTPETRIEHLPVALSAWSHVGDMVKARQVARSVPIDGGVRLLTVGSAGGNPVDKTAEVFTR